MSTNRRDFLKLAGAAAAAITSTAAAHAGVPASSVAKFDEQNMTSSLSVPVLPAWPAH